VDSEQKRHFTTQFMRFQNRIFAFIVTLLPDRNEAEETSQETGLLLWENCGKFDTGREFVPCAYACAFNVVRSLRRKKGRSPTALSVGVLEAVAETRHKADELLKIQRQAPSVCLGNLPNGQRDLIERCHLGKRNLKGVTA
jgi:RNA polymerase sigma-70 factor (ECF subfamily)